ncbi:MAG: response regulator, partial [Anaerolineales bacterium]
MSTILIIEDEPELIKVLRDYLEKAGFTVESAYRGDTGLSIWEHKRPDLVLLDLNLPGMDGLDVAREIRR